jgi:DNA-binding IscR family transcriptional regulator
MNGRILEGICEKYESGTRECRHQSSCAISPVWKKLGDLIENYLDSVTIEQLMGDPETTLSATEALR